MRREIDESTNPSSGWATPEKRTGRLQTSHIDSTFVPVDDEVEYNRRAYGVDPDEDCSEFYERPEHWAET